MIQGDEKICFDLYGDENMEMVLLDENRSGLKIWAKLKKRIQKQQTIVFDKIFIQTPKPRFRIIIQSELSFSNRRWAQFRP